MPRIIIPWTNDECKFKVLDDPLQQICKVVSGAYTGDDAADDESLTYKPKRGRAHINIIWKNKESKHHPLSYFPSKIFDIIHGEPGIKVEQLFEKVKSLPDFNDRYEEAERKEEFQGLVRELIYQKIIGCSID